MALINICKHGKLLLVTDAMAYTQPSCVFSAVYREPGTCLNQMCGLTACISSIYLTVCSARSTYVNFYMQSDLLGKLEKLHRPGSVPAVGNLGSVPAQLLIIW